MNPRLDPFVAALMRDELPGHSDRAERNHITEAELFRGYSGLLDRRDFAVTADETVRRRLAAAYGIAASDGVGSRESPPPPDDDAEPAMSR